MFGWLLLPTSPIVLSSFWRLNLSFYDAVQIAPPIMPSPNLFQRSWKVGWGARGVYLLEIN